MKRPEGPVCLMILDGWGIGKEEATNAPFVARMPFLKQLEKTYPTAQLIASGNEVGLPKGVMGNSEVGHMNLGAGRIVYQDLLRINRAIEEESFFHNPTLQIVLEKMARTKKSLHLMGLVSDGGVHSEFNHIVAVLEAARRKGVPHVFIHAILDGRDTPPTSGKQYIEKLTAILEKNAYGTIASICGRFYAMDRDTRWERVAKAYALYTQGIGTPVHDAATAVQEAYDKGQTDEFVEPIVLVTNENKPRAFVSDGDAVIVFNFRADRMREITRAFIQPDFAEFARSVWPKVEDYVTMTSYDDDFKVPVLFAPEIPSHTLGEIVSRAGLRQLRIAETEKYAHVTYFFNGGSEECFPLENRVLIPSPRDVATYDQKPQMSAEEISLELVRKINEKDYGFIVLNFANMDMVGHTGILSAAICACEALDPCIERVVKAVLAKKGVLFITADHGNAEKMADENGHPHTAHTINPVRIIFVGEKTTVQLQNGILGDMAPTVLEVLGLSKPDEMTGASLFLHSSS